MLNIFITIYGLALASFIIDFGKTAAKSIIEDIED